MRLAILSLTSLALAACGQNAGNNAATANAANAAAPATTANEAAPANNNSAAAAPASRRETVTGTFTGWEMGDYLYAHIQVPGREMISAQPGPTPIDLFLDANKGRQVTVEISTTTENVPENGGPMEVERITAARNAAGTAEAWYQALSAADRAAAQHRFEQGALSGR